MLTFPLRRSLGCRDSLVGFCPPPLGRFGTAPRSFPHTFIPKRVCLFTSPSWTNLQPNAQVFQSAEIDPFTRDSMHPFKRYLSICFLFPPPGRSTFRHQNLCLTCSLMFTFSCSALSVCNEGHGGSQTATLGPSYATLLYITRPPCIPSRCTRGEPSAETLFVR